jgi:hypothetical protein
MKTGNFPSEREREREREEEKWKYSGWAEKNEKVKEEIESGEWWQVETSW